MQVFLIIAGAVFGATMLWAVVLPFRPSSLGISARFLCRDGEKFEVVTSVASYHQPGERSISVYCNDYGNRRDVKGKALLFGFLFAFAAFLPIAIAAYFFISRYVLGLN